jgi:hypothetical protein
MARTLVPDSLALMFAVLSANKDRQPDGPFPMARDVIFGTAFAIADDLFLTAGHVVEAAASVGDVSLGRFAISTADGAFDVAADWEVFEGVDIALIKCPGFSPAIFQMHFGKLPIFSEVRAMGFANGLEPEYHSYAPRGYLGHVVAGLQQFRLRGQPFSYELSFVPPKGLSGAPLIPSGFGPSTAAGIVTSSQSVEVDGSATHVGVAIAAEELLRLSSRIIGGPVATMFGCDQVAARERIEAASVRLAELRQHDEVWPE